MQVQKPSLERATNPHGAVLRREEHHSSQLSKFARRPQLLCGLRHSKTLASKMPCKEASKERWRIVGGALDLRQKVAISLRTTAAASTASRGPSPIDLRG